MKTSHQFAKELMDLPDQPIVIYYPSEEDETYVAPTVRPVKTRSKNGAKGSAWEIVEEVLEIEV